jgi:hypothetical protein
MVLCFSLAYVFAELLELRDLEIGIGLFVSQDTFDFRIPDGSSGARKLGDGCCVSLGKSILCCIVSYMPQSLQCSEGCEERVGR